MHANANVQASAAAVPPTGRQGQSPEAPRARTEGGLAHLNNAAEFGIGANRRVQSASRTFLTHPAPTNAGGTKAGRDGDTAHYFFVPKSTLGVCISVGAMSNVAIGCEDEYMSERQMRPGKVTSSVL